MNVEAQTSTINSMSEVPASAWNALVGDSDPFSRHEFLLALEQSESVGPETGWVPFHLLIHRSGKLVAAVPLYLKNHSYGEYIFDWSWANAALQNGIPYYPKLVSAIPFTPATGCRILTGSEGASSALISQVCDALLSLAKKLNAQSFHLLFVTPEERVAWQTVESVVTRTTHQYHWHNPGVNSFDEWLSTFRARRRKDVIRERRNVEKLGVEISVVKGTALSEPQWEALEFNYRRTVHQKGGAAYLTPHFFQILRTSLASMVLAFIAHKDGVPVASSLCFQQGTHLYGRYWGCDEGYRALHFELCYHKPIEYCIQMGWSRFEAGAQGLHKIQRGLLPAATHSVHWIAHTGLHQAIEGAVSHDNKAELSTIETLKHRGPFHRGST
jgi:predicted N-acyltransferase